ncbi:SNF2 helicase associated domain-containing protein [Heyndrickxia sporothermodurans]
MNLRINNKIIQDRCGMISFKRGEAFFRANKVSLQQLQSNGCEAIVKGTEDFIVLIKEENGNLYTKCSCPILASFQKDCQHIAAVLIAIAEHQRNGKPTIPVLEPQFDSNNPLTEGLLNIFNDHSKRSSSHQLHFENRQLLEAQFLCRPIESGHGYLMGIQMKIASRNIPNLREFLIQVKKGETYSLTNFFTYDPSIYCFQTNTDAVIQELLQVVQDEKVFITEHNNQLTYTISDDMILIPPSSWGRLAPLLVNASSVMLEINGQIVDGLRISEEKLPLQFDLSGAEGKEYRLQVSGLNRIVIFHPYHSVFADGKWIQLKSEESNRLFDLKKMLDDSKTNQVSFSNNQIHLFIEKVVPGLRKLGEVHINGTMAEHFRKAPLKAKLYLDRVRNRLLAGLEFHYENMVINPIENREFLTGSMIIRDVEKEEEILQLMDQSSFTKTEEGYFLHNEELEYEFLYHVLPKLQNLVQVYATTAVRNRISKGNNRPQIRVKLKKERMNWLEFTFEMDGIPEKHIRDILIALEEKRKYYRLRDGSLLSLETKELEEIKRFLKAVPIQNEDWEGSFELPIIKAIPYLDSMKEGTFLIESSFRQFLETLKNPGSMEFDVPVNLESIMREYQKRGYRWIKTLAHFGFGGILADDMGLGKTLQSIAYIVSVLDDIRNEKRPALIICPSSLTYNWLNELMKFAPDVQAVVIDGDQKERSQLQKEALHTDVMITSYPLMRRDIKWYEKQSFYTVFFDEAQAFKNPITQTAKAVKKIHAKHRFALTGTPIENSLEELWSIFYVVFPELFLGLKEFSNLTKKTISRRVQPFLLRRLKEDVLSELPEKIESTDSVDLLPDQKKLYAAYLAKLRHDTLKHLDRDTIRKNRIRILAGLTRLRQICCHPALFVEGYKGGSAKFQQLLQIIKEAQQSGRRVLIFSQFTKMLELIGRELVMQGLPYFYLDGQTPSEERIEICNRFNSGERNLFLISLKAGGTGLNLTGADTVILYDTWWNPAVENQAADRAYRIGQQNSVQVIKLVARGTIEEKMNELQEKKRHLISEIVDTKEKASSTLTEDDIREILML